MYRGINDPRFLLLPHDHDTDFGEGDGSALPPPARFSVRRRVRW
jgi:hypothetical protein